MIRFLNLLASVCLLATAAYAYTIKYETILRVEEIAKLENRIRKEREAVALLRAEWAYATRPDRIQTLSDKYLDLVIARPAQVIDFSLLPDRPRQIDSIGRKLEELGLAAPTQTPEEARGAVTPGGEAQ